jgi:cyanophycinase
MTRLFSFRRLSVRRWLVWAVTLGSLLVSLTARAWIQYQSDQVPPTDLEISQRFGGGTLMICGGGRIPPEVLSTFIEMAGGRNSHLVVIPAYETNDAEIEELKLWWQKQGAATVDVLYATSREEATQPDFSKSLDKATAVWLTGGAQRISAAKYAGTIVEDRVRQVVQRGGIVGGTSAGAAIMSKHMIEQGITTAVESNGFDLLPNSIVDQHFLRRNRLQRMHGLLAKYPGVTGFGIDEGTALIVRVDRGNVIVIGDSYVCAVTPAHGENLPHFAILKHGDECTLDGLRTGNEVINSRLAIDDLLAWE